MENQILNIKGNLVVLNLDLSKFQEDGVIIYVEGNILSEREFDEKFRNHAKISRQSYIDQEKFIPIKSIRTFTHQGN